VSYGIPFRWSASRLLASDMRSVVCGSHHNDTAACDALINLPKWTVDKFLGTYVGSDMASLLSPLAANVSSNTQPSLLDLHRHMMGETTLAGLGRDVLQRPDEDSLLWDGQSAPGWVACNQHNKTCFGHIKKADWYSTPAKRAKSCLDAFQQQVKSGKVSSSAVGIDICNLNSKTNELCQVIYSIPTPGLCSRYDRAVPVAVASVAPVLGLAAPVSICRVGCIISRNYARWAQLCPTSVALALGSVCDEARKRPAARTLEPPNSLHILQRKRLARHSLFAVFFAFLARVLLSASPPRAVAFLARVLEDEPGPGHGLLESVDRARHAQLRGGPAEVSGFKYD
jgi:hypothetical protein